VKEIVTNLEKSYEDSFNAFNELESKFENANYDEEFEDTLSRKYEEGYSDALSMVLSLIKNSICVTCNEVKDIEMHGHCGACYYGWTTKKESAI
jgi:hypothetical protein